MNHREIDILKYLLSKERFVTYEEVGAFLNLSVSTIRMCLDNIDQELMKQGLLPIERKPHYGIKINCSTYDQINNLINRKLSKINVIDFQKMDNRLAFILFSIMCSEERVTIASLADITEVSQRTIQNDISNLKKELNKVNCSIKYVSNDYHIFGNDITMRTLLVNMMKSCMLSTDESELVTILLNNYSLIFNDTDTFEIKVASLNEFLQSIIPVNYPEISRYYILIYLCLLGLYHNKFSNESIDKKEKEYLEDSSLFEIAIAMIRETNKLFDQNFGICETYYLTIVLHTLPIEDFSKYKSVYPLEIELLCHQFILSVSKNAKYPFYKDSELSEIIINHFIPTLERMRFDNQIKNPIANLVQEKYSYLHNSVVKSIHILEGFGNFTMDNDEITLFTLYFASSKEKLEHHRDPKDVLIVCNSGNAISRLIQYKLNNSFDINITNFISKNQLQDEVVKNKPDLIISVIQLEEEFKGIPVVVVSPIISPLDIQNLKKHLDIIDTIENKSYDKEQSELLKYLKKEMFKVNVECNNAEDLIIEGGKLLVKGKCANKEYIGQMLEVQKKHPSHSNITIAPYIILPHAGISENVYKIGFSFIKLKEEIWVDDNPIKIAIAMCTNDSKKHEKAVQELGHLINDEVFLNKVLDVEDYQEFSMLVLKTLGKEN